MDPITLVGTRAYAWIDNTTLVPDSSSPQQVAQSQPLQKKDDTIQDKPPTSSVAAPKPIESKSPTSLPAPHYAAKTSANAGHPAGASPKANTGPAGWRFQISRMNARR